MLFKLSDSNIKDADFDILKKLSDKEIIIDLQEVKFLSSRTITKLLVLCKAGKKIRIKNANFHIRESIEILKLEDVLVLEE